MYRREGAKCLRRKAAFPGDADKCFCRGNTCVRPKEKLQRRGDMFLCDGVSLHCRENKTHPSSAELHQPVEFHSLAKGTIPSGVKLGIVPFCQRVEFSLS